MSDREDKIRRVVAELDVHMAEVEASVAVLKALLAEDEVPGAEDLIRTSIKSCRVTTSDATESSPKCRRNVNPSEREAVV